MVRKNDVAPHRRRTMDTELMLDVGQANELKLAFRRTGWSNGDIKKLCEGDWLAQLLPVLKGNAKIALVKHVIDCDALPYIPNGWEVRPEDQLLNTVKGQLEWDPTKIAFYLSDGQKDGKVIKGEKLRKELGNQPILNANVLDFLLAHPELIPEEWKSEYVFFWGTIYRYSGGRLNVRYLSWGGSRWDWYCRWLEYGFDARGPAVVARK